MSYTRSICKFAATLLYRPIRHDMPPAETNWKVWLGKRKQSDERCLGPEGVIKTKGVKRQPRSKRYQVDYLKKIAGTPRQPLGPETGCPVLVRPNPSPEISSVPDGPLRRPGQGKQGADYEGGPQNDGTTTGETGGQRRRNEDYPETRFSTRPSARSAPTALRYHATAQCTR